MEIDTKNGSKIHLKNPSETIDFGRGLGIKSTDPTVSRRHISFKLNESQTGVHFKVNGKNPVWVRESSNGEIRVYKSSETGEINCGDSICVSSKSPVWFNLNKIDENCNELKGEIQYDDVFAETSEIDYGDIETTDVSVMDPVKEFKFVVMGHEFDSYSKKVIRDMRNWDWFLEEGKEKSDDDSERESKKGKRRKRKKGDEEEEDDDDVWTGESEEDVEMIKKLNNSQKPKYTTRSKKQEKNKNGPSTSKNVKDNTKKKAMDDDENDETLGGFIVEDEDIGEGNDDDDDEEEEFDDDDDE